MLVQTGSFTYQEVNPPSVGSGNTALFQKVTFDVPFPVGIRPIVIPFVQPLMVTIHQV